MRFFAITLCLALCLAVGAGAQNPVADTLDARGYFPLAVGNVWEYEHFLFRPASIFRPIDESETRLEQYRVIDSLVRSDTLWHVIDFRERSEENELIVADRFEVRYDTASQSIVGGPRISGWLRCLDAAAGVHDSGPYDCWPFVHFDEWVLPGLFGTEPVPVKSFGAYSWAFAVVHGVGLVRGGGGCEPCGTFDDRDDWHLRYASVGGSTYGTHIVGTESRDRPAGTRLMAYPNPTTGSLTIRAVEAARVDLFNLLGQRLRSEVVDRTGRALLQLNGLPSGLYILRSGRASAVVVLM